ncbi:MAG TPA: anthranilate synthase component I family protein [Chitinophagaceae bacterium]|nr:anthranilate synthase component I family protein [Chitinophagaceae bacterium]
MNRKFTSYPVDNFIEIKTKMLNWTKQFNIFCLLDNHEYNPDPRRDTSGFECLLAAGSVKTISAKAGNAFDSLQHFVSEEKDWLFGHLAYDLKNEVENITSQNFDGIQYPDLSFFIPEVVVILKKSCLEIGAIKLNANNIYQKIISATGGHPKINKSSPQFKGRFSKAEYLKTVASLQQHILRGDCYEVNFCQEFYLENYEIDPLDIYLRLSNLSPNPFAAFYKLKDKYLLCSSPERYLKKISDKIYSQPIKGTAKRNLNNIAEDERNKKELSLSKKETSENVMVVDLVRNDLSKICLEGSVKVEELFGLYTFPQVHQMISTVSGTLSDHASLSDILKATFPMGSMTGVPKKNVMELIEKYEKTKRGLFSGAIGYITPDGDFDFNVVIRSILYNSTNKYVSIQAGSAITFYSHAEKEFEECLVKIEAMKKVMEY